MFRLAVVAALFISFSPLVLAFSSLEAPTLNISMINDTLGRYDVSFNAPSDVPDNHEYRLYESTDSGNTWKIISNSSKAAGDSTPFVTSVLNKSNGTYQYKGFVCLTKSTECSLSPVPSPIIVSKNPTDSYALKFDGVDNYVSLYPSHPISIGWCR